jgi:mannose-6-phosphate isomerase-like protein (cupin superfamily)
VSATDGAAPVPVLSRAGEGEALRGVTGVGYRVRLSGADTAGELAVVDCVLDPAAVGAAPHTHHGHAETFEVVAGEVAFTVGTDEVVLGPDGWVTVPRGVRHGFRNAGPGQARLRFVLTPAGYEDYFRQVAARIASGDEPTPDELALLRSRFRTTTG